MPSSSLPGEPPEWATGPGRRNPDPLPGSLQTSGFIANTVLPALLGNALWGRISDWTRYWWENSPANRVLDMIEIRRSDAGGLTLRAQNGRANLSGSTRVIVEAGTEDVEIGTTALNRRIRVYGGALDAEGTTNGRVIGYGPTGRTVVRSLHPSVWQPVTGVATLPAGVGYVGTTAAPGTGWFVGSGTGAFSFDVPIGGALTTPAPAAGEQRQILAYSLTTFGVATTTTYKADLYRVATGTSLPVLVDSTGTVVSAVSTRETRTRVIGGGHNVIATDVYFLRITLDDGGGLGINAVDASVAYLDLDVVSFS